VDENVENALREPATFRTPGGIFRTLGGIFRTPGGIFRTLGGIFRTLGGIKIALFPEENLEIGSLI